MHTRPLIGLTADIEDGRHQLRHAYLDAVIRAGGLPVILPCDVALVEQIVHGGMIHGIIFTGGNDPIMEPFGQPTHARAKPVDPRRQAFELALLQALERHRPELPVLGICLGMQMMGLHAGGSLDQHLPDSLVTAGDHWANAHAVHGEIGAGVVASHHRQALIDPGNLCVSATSDDGTIEAIQSPPDSNRPFYLGVQWHPERTDDETLGLGVIQRLVDAARLSQERAKQASRAIV